MNKSLQQKHFCALTKTTTNMCMSSPLSSENYMKLTYFDNKHTRETSCELLLLAKGSEVLVKKRMTHAQQNIQSPNQTNL